MINITPSKLRDYIECPLKFQYQQADRTPMCQTPALAFGNTMHAALQQLYITPEVINELEGLLESLWSPNAFEHYAESSGYFARGLNALENYCKEYLSDTGEPLGEKTVGTEKFFSYLIDGNDGLSVRFGCKVDRLSLTDDGVLEVIDYKTGANGSVPASDSLAADLPAFIYHSLTRLNFPNQKRIRLRYINVMSLNSSAVELSPEQVFANKAALWRYVQKIDAGVFEPNVTEACAWCSYRDGCPAMNRTANYASIY